MSSSATTPWWAIPLVAGLFAFFGVLLAQVVTLWIERGRNRRDDRRRWDQERRTLYARIFDYATVKALERCQGRLETGIWPTMDEDVLKLPMELEMLSTSPVRATGKHLLNLVSDVSKFAVDDKLMVTASAELGKRMHRFMTAVRDELGIELHDSRKVIITSASRTRLLKAGVFLMLAAIGFRGPTKRLINQEKLAFPGYFQESARGATVDPEVSAPSD
ncbi:hypothetical protein [Actinoplanes sp. TFC3]|uniref:hypothetical protein n=1 Tax=Actinoplanes sp. TFC3 TaxID=1710355 RepID=UPI001379E164|nr:hypothetical protein [Actinoplanes sp. TFC3]